jgi:hypothetical protein
MLRFALFVPLISLAYLRVVEEQPDARRCAHNEASCDFMSMRLAARDPSTRRHARLGRQTRIGRSANNTYDEWRCSSIALYAAAGATRHAPAAQNVDRGDEFIGTAVRKIRGALRRGPHHTHRRAAERECGGRTGRRPPHSPSDGVVPRRLHRHLRGDLRRRADPGPRAENRTHSFTFVRACSLHRSEFRRSDDGTAVAGA